MSDDWIELKEGDIQYKVSMNNEKHKSALFVLCIFHVCFLSHTMTNISSPQIIDTRAGSDGKQPQYTDTVLIDFEGRQCDDKNAPIESYPVFQTGKQMVVTFTDLVLVKALEIALTHMQAGQTALVWSRSKYALGDTQARTCNNVVVPPSSNVVYKVTLLQVLMETGRINPYLPIQKALAQKNTANDLYQCEWPGQCERTLTLYTKAARDMDTLLHGTYFSTVESDHPQRKQVKDIMLDCLNNIVAVHMRNKQYDQAYEATQQVLRRDANNVKALFRAAKSRMMDRKCSLGEQDDALCAAENVIIYKDKEEVELKKLRVQWKKRKQTALSNRPTE